MDVILLERIGKLGLVRAEVELLVLVVLLDPELDVAERPAARHGQRGACDARLAPPRRRPPGRRPRR